MLLINQKNVRERKIFPPYQLPRSVFRSCVFVVYVEF